MAARIASASGRCAGAAGTGSARVDLRPEQLEHPRKHRYRADDRTPTTAIVPLAIPSKIFEPMMNMPAIAIATVVPETMTVRPDVRAVRSSASCDGRPRGAPAASG